MSDRSITGRSPQAICAADLEGDLHVHSTWSDGKRSIRDLAAAYLAEGFEHVAICDHTDYVTSSIGLDPVDFERQWQEIEQINATLDGFRVLKEVECEVLRDGELEPLGTRTKTTPRGCWQGPSSSRSFPDRAAEKPIWANDR